MRTLCALLLFLSAPAAAAQSAPERVDQLFDQAYTIEQVLSFEAAIAQAQAAEGLISQAAADEIARTATLDVVSAEAVAEEYDVVRHRMVALLNVWRRSLSPEAARSLHFGATTVDIYDTVRVLQVRAAIDLMRRDLLEIEDQLVALAIKHRDTPMVGRTLGQQALPITFGKKVAVWASANRRNIDRLDAVYCRLGTLGVLKGAVGTHLGLPGDGASVEARTAEGLGLGPLDPADWHGMRDVFGEYASVLAIMARTQAAIGQEVFLLQMTDIGEVYEERPESAVSSSTLPHKRNPSRSEALMHAGRVIPATATILIDDVANLFERDNTSRPNGTLEDITMLSAEAIGDLSSLLRRLRVDEARMRENLDRTGGMILGQRIVFAVQDRLDKEEAEDRVTQAARRAMANGTDFRAELLADDTLAPLLGDDIDALLDPTTYLGDATGQVDRTVAWLAQRSGQRSCTAQ